MNKLKHTLINKISHFIIQNEYKFYVNFKGQLFFVNNNEDYILPNCIKDAKFIKQLFKHIKCIQQQQQQQSQYKWVSQFWGQSNRISCAVSPIVFNYLLNSKLQFSIGQQCQFQPQLIKVDQNGLLWHPYFRNNSDTIYGVFGNELMIHLIDKISSQESKSYLQYNGNQYQLSQK